MLILVSNDDGVYAPGIRILAQTLKKIPRSKVVVVAPDRNKSAASHSLTLHRPLRFQKVSRNVWSVDGTPTDAVMLAVHKILKVKPDLIVSGINGGANLGEDVHYSGTVSAALEGAIMGIPAIAISVTGPPPFQFSPAASFTLKLTKKVLKEGLPPGVVLNVNIPNKPAGKLKGHEFTILGKHNYGDVLVEKMDPQGRAYYWIGGNPRQFEDIPGSDGKAFHKNKISITPIQVNWTDYAFLNQIKDWKL